MSKNNEWAPAWNERATHKPFFLEGNMSSKIFTEKDSEKKLLWELDHFNKPHAIMRCEDGSKHEIL